MSATSISECPHCCRVNKQFCGFMLIDLLGFLFGEANYVPGWQNTITHRCFALASIVSVANKTQIWTQLEKRLIEEARSRFR